MGKGTFDLKAEKIELRYQYAPKMKKHELFYKLLRLVTVVCEIWDLSQTFLSWKWQQWF